MDYWLGTNIYEAMIINNISNSVLLFYFFWFWVIHLILVSLYCEFVAFHTVFTLMSYLNTFIKFGGIKVWIIINVIRKQNGSLLH